MKPNMGDMCEMAGKSAKNGITEGVIWKQILIFFFPILIGTFFQQLYNTVDAVVVGRFAGKEALSSVGGSPWCIWERLLFMVCNSRTRSLFARYSL